MRSLRNCLTGDLGLTVCPEVSLREEAERGLVKKISWHDDDELQTSVIMIWHSEKWCSPLLDRFMALSLEHIR